MPKAHSPRHGSMQYWPRKRARREIPRIRSRPGNAKIEGFYGYKAGMTHIMVRDTYSNSPAKNQIVSKPITLIECPPLKVAGVRFYKKSSSSLIPSNDVYADKLDKELSKRMIVPKAKEIKGEFDDLRLIVYTMPKFASVPKKKPEVFELCLGGSNDEKLAYAKEKLGKEIDVSEVFKINELVDIHGVTKGKGFQGPVKRFGIQIRRKKSEKTKRGPGSLGSWCGQQHFMYRVAHAGQMGYNLRTEYNKPIILIGKEPEKVNPKGGFIRYGNIKSSYIAVVGSIPGPKKRMLRLIHSIRPNPKKNPDKLKIISISLESKQK